MPEAVTFNYQNKVHAMYFSHAKAMLPVLTKDGEYKFVAWGRRQQEESELPLGGWARLASIYAGKWDIYFPKPVQLPITKFMQTDFEGRTHWHDVVKGQWVQGLLIKSEEEYRVYIVTIVPERLDICYERWPRILMSEVGRREKKSFL